MLHFDAHADLRRAYEGFEHSHASIMDNVVEGTRIAKLVQVGIRDLCEEEAERIRGSGGKIVTFFDSDLAEAALRRRDLGKAVRPHRRGVADSVYVSFDIDGLDPALCPHTGTKVPGGLSFQMATSLIAMVVKSGRKLLGFDLTEVAPAQDGSEWDENVGARMLYKLIGWALKSAAGK